MKIQVQLDRRLLANTKRIGTINENDFEVLKFTFPEELEGYSKYIEIQNTDGKFVAQIENDEYAINRALTKYNTIDIQIVCKDLVNDIVYKSDIATFTLENSINASEDLETEQQGLLDTILLDIQECQGDINDIQTSLGSLDRRVVTNEGDISEIKAEQLTQNGNISANAGKIATIETDYGKNIVLTIDSDYLLKVTLNNKSGQELSMSSVDLPLESMIVDASYSNGILTLELQNGNTVDIDISSIISGLQQEITVDNKLSSDLVDDTNSTNKFVTASEKTTWNAKYDKPAGGIPKTDLASDVQTSLGKADTALQEHQSLADYVKNTDYATSNKGGVFMKANLYATDIQSGGYLKSQVKTYENYTSGNTEMFISKGTLENVITGKNLETSNNKVTSISSSSTDTQYPSAKCVYDLVGNVESILEALDIGGGISG